LLKTKLSLCFGKELFNQFYCFIFLAKRLPC